MKTYQLFTLIVCCSIATITAQDLKIYVSDAENFVANSGKIIQYDIDGSNPQLFIDEELSWPQDIVFIPNTNFVIVSNLNSRKITKYNAVTGDYIEDFAAVAGGPTRMKIGPDGLLYVIQWSNSNNKVLRYELDGTFVDEFTDVGVPTSIGIDWDAGGQLYISSFGQGTVTQFNTSGESQGVFVDSAELSGPTNIYFDNNGNLYVFDWNDGDIEKYSSSGMYLETYIDGLNEVEGIDFLENGNLLVGNGGTAQIKEYEFDGTFVGNIVPTGAGGLEQPNAVIIFDRATLSTPENNLAFTQLVTPSIGTEFTLLENAKNTLDSLQIYSTSGKIVATLALETNSWNASSYTEGIYFVVGMVQGKKITQKVIVKK